MYKNVFLFFLYIVYIYIYMLSEVFYTFAITSGCALVLSIAKLCFKSKCSDIDICCVKIKRDTLSEEKEFEIESHNKKNDSDDDERNNKK